MAHIKKFKQAGLGHMLQHYDRTTSPEHVHPEKTKYNYNLAEQLQPLPQMEFVHARTSQVKVQRRADVNLMCDCVVTAPKSLDRHDYKRFFRSAFRSLARRYGRENVISAYVHMDETTPHMHFAWIPVVHDFKKGIDKVSAKDVVNRFDLQTLHKALQDDISHDLGYQVEILNGATKDGNTPVYELKNASKEELVSTLLESDISNTYLVEENKRLKRRIDELEHPTQELDFFKDFDDFDRD